ncbi:hypothetical protein OpiT1DRAFT_04765 [Opitutaceae bacterium TAV1]|nr:hypothetical protein OpiT1DRAFT_04765 [Opitutaceae bacterium TAV1]
MAIKLETKHAAPSAAVRLEICSAGDSASIVLTTEDVQQRVNDEWVTSVTHRKQVLSFVAADGQAMTLTGRVDEREAVEIPAAHKVVVEVTIATGLQGAFERGAKSRAYTALDLAKVVEVWDNPKTCLWRARNGVSEAVKSAGAEFDMGSGKISK